MGQAIRFDDLPSMVDQIEKVKTEVDLSDVVTEIRKNTPEVDFAPVFAELRMVRDERPELDSNRILKEIKQIKTDVDFSSILAELQVLRTQVDMLHQSRDRPEGKEGLCTKDSLTVSVDLRAPEERYSDSVGSLADSYTVDFFASGSLRIPDGCDGNPEASELGAP